jgi:hypothetical protein
VYPVGHSQPASLEQGIHAPLTHSFEAHLFPHMPQLVGLVSRSTQTPLQSEGAKAGQAGASARASTAVPASTEPMDGPEWQAVSSTVTPAAATPLAARDRPSVSIPGEYAGGRSRRKVPPREEGGRLSPMRHSATALVALLLAFGACRQIAGLGNLSAPADAGAPENDGGLGCKCEGCQILASSVTPQSLVIVDGSVYWLEPADPPEDAGPTGGTGRVLSVSTGGGVPVELASGLALPVGLTTDGEALYFYESQFASIDRLRLDGKADEVERIVTGLSSAPSYEYGWAPLPTPAVFGSYQCADTALLGLSGGMLYFGGNSAYDGGDPWAILGVSTSGGDVQTLLGTLSKDGGFDEVADAGPLVDTIALTVQGDTVYWLDSGGSGCSAPSGSPPPFQLWSVSAMGGKPPRLMGAFSAATNLIAAGEWILVAEGSTQIARVAIDGSGDGPPIADQQQAFAFARDDAFVYWSTLGNGANQGTIVKMPLAGGSLVTLVGNVDGVGLAAPVALAVDDESVYWADTVCDAIFKAPKSAP